jgi:Carboxypeptidase regulatory-like domain/TonB-dependent Receptor Plug Domain
VRVLFPRIAFVFACAASLAFPLAAQSPNGTINGRVVDPSNGVIVGADVMAINDVTGVQHTTKTNAEGIYVLPNLPPGPYRLQISELGFKTIIKPDIVIHVQDALAINFTLPIGAASEIVTVEGGAPLINTTDASVGTIVDRKFVENVPLNGRSFQDLISMTPGVVTQSPNSSPSVGAGGDFSVNGQRTESNYYTVDGVSANVAAGTGFGQFGEQPAASGSVPAGTALGTTQSLISVDALQEFRVQSSSYSAEYGRGPGGQFSLVTRSGTNDLHGTVFDYLRNGFFDANDWFNDSLGVPKSSLRQNDFGGTLGGPVLLPGLYDGKDKTFFFASYEGLRLTQPQPASSNVLVPDTFMRQQAPAALEPILNAFPVQTANGIDFGTAAAPGLAQFIGGYSLPSRIDSTSIRLDNTFGPKLSLFFRFGYTPSSVSSRGSLGSLSVLSQNSISTQTYTLGAVSQFSSGANNDFRLGYARSDSTIGGTLDNFGGATLTDLAAVFGASASVGPSLTMLIYVPGTGFSRLQDNTASANRLRQWNLVDTFSIVSGHHQFKIGTDYRRITSPATQASPTIEGVYFGAQQVLSNLADIVLVEKQLSATPIFNETAVFFQDEWRATGSLNISLGLRWEVDPPPHGANGQDAYTLLGSLNDPGSLSLAPRGTSLWKASWYNFAPRLGLAWTARNTLGWETVVRAGGGVFFDTSNQVAASGFSDLGFSAAGQYFGAPLPATPAQLSITPSVTAPYTSVPIDAFPQHLQLPYTIQWNVAVQQAIAKKQTFTLTYLGAAGRRQSGAQQLSYGSLNPNFETINYWRTGLTSDYDALQAQFQRSVSRSVSALASYTWSHCIDFGSSYIETPVTRGNCDMDVRHNFQAGVTWDLPGVSGNRPAQELLNHWGLDSRLIARTAFPVTLQGNYLIDPTTGVGYYSNLDLVPNQPIYVYGSQYPGGRAINPAAFSYPSGDDPGDAPRNFARGLGEWQINFGVRREFSIREKLRLQFRAEAFNILNHPNFGYVDPSLGDSTFGRALYMLNQNLSTVAPQYQQGGPRSMQFALKLLF